MALVPCPECQKEVSTEAVACPQCAFPHPGKKSFSSGKILSASQPCPGCGHSVSKQSSVCQSCGISLVGERNGNAVAEVEEGALEETWLCPHCGTPYTRKVKRSGGAMDISSGKPPASGPLTPVQLSGQVDSQQRMPNAGVSKGSLARRRPALWQDPLRVDEDTAANTPRFPRSRKKSLILAIVGIILIVVAGGLGALWQFKGITPLELFAFLQM